MAFDEIIVRPATLEDADALALVGSATFLEAFAGTLQGPAIVAHCMKTHTPAVYRQYLEDRRCRTFLALTRKGEAPVGYIMLTPPDLPLTDLTSADLELKRIYLFSRFHGSGVGQALMSQAIATARELQAPRLFLGVFAGNARALAFYSRNGFKEVGRRTFQIGTQICDDLVLGRSL